MKPRNFLNKIRVGAKRAIGPIGRRIVRRAVNPVRIALAKKGLQKTREEASRHAIKGPEIVGKRIGEAIRHMEVTQDLAKARAGIKERTRIRRLKARIMPRKPRRKIQVYQDDF